MSALIIVIGLTHHCIRWAMLPGFWMGSVLGPQDETAQDFAYRVFGPVLLVHFLIDDPEAVAVTSKDEVLDVWGQLESATRLRLIIWVLCGLSCLLLVIATMRRME